MPQRFHPLPAGLLAELGRISDLQSVAQTLAALGMVLPELRQTCAGAAYPLRASGYGLDLMLQCVNPQAPEASLRWGLRALVFHTGQAGDGHAWPHPWPDGWSLEDATSQALIAWCGVEADEVALCTDTLVVFPLTLAHGSTCVVQATHAPHTLRLQSLTLLHHGDWLSVPWPDGPLLGADATAQAPVTPTSLSAAPASHLGPHPTAAAHA